MISVFTPVHATSAPFLIEAYGSLLDQTFEEFEWILLENNGGRVHGDIRLDPRVRVLSTDNLSGIGALKRFCCEHSRGDILFELDADDLLSPTALEECVKSFNDPLVQFAYSNTVEFMDKTWAPSVGYDPFYGWQYRDCVFNGHPLREAVSWPATYQSMRRVLWACNHFKAFRASAYKEVGGHDPGLHLGDDFDLMCRFYLKYGQVGFCHMDKPLYGYRVHDHNTVKTQNQPLQMVMNQLYLKYIEPLALRWADDEKLHCLDLGGRINPSPSGYYFTVDLFGADIDLDLNGEWYWPKSDSVGVIRAKHVVEHLNDPIHFFNEAYRVLAPGGLLMLEVPSIVCPDGKSIGLGAFRDPTHKTFWSEQNIWYFTRKQYAQFIQPAYKGRFQESRIETWMMEKDCPVVTAELICLKEPYESRRAGEILI